MALGPDAHLGPYRIVRPIGRGGMGEVYEAQDTRLGRRRVAIKIVLGEFSDRFLREARAVSLRVHANPAPCNSRFRSIRCGRAWRPIRASNSLIDGA